MLIYTCANNRNTRSTGGSNAFCIVWIVMHVAIELRRIEARVATASDLTIFCDVVCVNLSIGDLLFSGKHWAIHVLTGKVITSHGAAVPDTPQGLHCIATLTKPVSWEGSYLDSMLVGVPSTDCMKEEVWFVFSDVIVEIEESPSITNSKTPLSARVNESSIKQTIPPHG